MSGGPAPTTATAVAPYEPALHTDLTGASAASAEARDETGGSAGGDAAELERMQAKAGRSSYQHLAPFAAPLLGEARQRLDAGGPIVDLLGQLGHLLGLGLHLDAAGSSPAKDATIAYHAALAAEIEDALLGTLPGPAAQTPEALWAEKLALARQLQAQFAPRLEDGVGLSIDVGAPLSAAEEAELPVTIDIAPNDWRQTAAIAGAILAGVGLLGGLGTWWWRRSNRRKLAGDIRRGVPDVALMEQARAGARTILTVVCPGGGDFGIKTMNDQVVGYAINSTVIIPRRNVLVNDAFVSRGFTVIEETYKGTTFAHQQEVGDVKALAVEAMAAIDVGVKPIFRDAFDQGEEFWTQQQERSQGAEAEEAGKRLAKIRSGRTKVNGDFHFDIQFGMAQMPAGGDDGPTYAEALAARMNASKAALMSRLGGDRTEQTDVGDVRGMVFDAGVFQTFCEAGVRLRDQIVHGGNTLRVKPGDKLAIQGMDHLIFLEGGRANPNVVREVRKGKLTPDMVHDGDVEVLGLFKQYFDHVNAFDYIKHFTGDQVGAVGAQVEQARQLVESLENNQNVPQDQAQRAIFGEDGAPPQAGLPSEGKFWDKVSGLTERIVLSVDIIDLGLDLFDGYARTMENVAGGENVDQESLGASDQLIRFKQQAVARLGVFYTARVEEAIEALPQDDPRRAALEAERTPTMLLGGDEITLSLHAELRPTVAAFVAHLTDVGGARGRVSVSTTSDSARGARDEHQKAMQDADPALGMVKHFEDKKRGLDLLVGRLLERDRAEWGARVNALGLHKLYVDVGREGELTYRRHDQQHDGVGAVVDVNTLEQAVAELRGQLEARI